LTSETFRLTLCLQRDAVVKVSKIHVINLKLVSYIVGIFLICLIAANFGIAQGVESPVIMERLIVALSI